MDFLIYLNDWPIICAGLCIVIALTAMSLYIVRLVSVLHAVRRQSSAPEPDDVPPVSVIVFTHNDAEGLTEVLSQIKGQDYPAPLDVIVVNDGKEESVGDIVASMGASWPELRITFTPTSVRNVSRRKLAVTLGLKAAMYDAVVLVTSSSRIDSPYWLRRMTAPFADPECEVVVGYAYPDPEADHRWGALVRAHESLIGAVHYLGAALTGMPYRGDGDNLAYRRSKFFVMRGFSNSLNLHYGDDDIFVCDAAEENNVRVAVSTQAQVRVINEDPVATYRFKQYRYGYTARYCSRGRTRLYTLVFVLMWIWLALLIPAVAGGYSSIPVLVMAGVSCLVLWVPLMVVWYKLSCALNSRHMLWSVPWLIMTRPLRNILGRWRASRVHAKHFAWQSIGDNV